jgi:ATP-dependent Clp protease ATP-binding subunit ClpA
MTSNVGSEHFRKVANPLGFVSHEGSVERVEADVQRDVERRFAPEFLNRVDEVVLFSPLTRDEAREIAARYVAHVAATMSASGKSLEVDDDALELLLVRGHSTAFGARFLKRAIDDQVKLPISEQWHEASRFRVRVRDGAVVTETSSRGRLAAGDEPSFEVA